MLGRTAKTWFWILFAGLMAFSVVGVTRLRFDFSFEAFLPQDDADLDFYRLQQQHFGQGGPSVNVALPHQPTIFDLQFLRRVDSLCRAVRKLPMVADVNSLLSLRDMVYHPLMPSFEKVLDIRHAINLKEAQNRILSDPRMVGNFISSDGKMLMVNISLKPGFNDSLEASLLDTLNHLTDKFGLEDNHMVGAPVTHHVLVGMQESQFVRYVGLASLVMVVVLSVVFRRFWGVAVAFLSVFGSMLLFFGLLGWWGSPLDLMSTMYPILLVVVGISDAVHVISKYADERMVENNPLTAMRNTLKDIGLATFFTSITTAVGLFSLMTSPMPPIRNFGWLAGCGVLLTFVGVMLVLPVCLLSLKPDQLMRMDAEKPLFSGWIGQILRLTSHKPRRILGISLLLLGLAGWGGTRVSSNLTASRDLPWGSDLLDDYVSVDAAFGGISTLDIALEAPTDSGFHDPARLRNLFRAASFLDEIPGVSQVLSAATYHRLANRYMNGNAPSAYRLPPDSLPPDFLRPVLQGLLKPALSYVLTEDGHHAMLMGRMPDLGSEEVAKVRDRFDDWARDSLGKAGIAHRHTGPRFLYDVNQRAVASGMMGSLLISVLSAGLFFAVAFRNLKIILASLIPNLVPLVATLGCIGWFGFELDPKVAMIFSIAYGIAVDDTIHFLSRYLIERRKGKGIDHSIEVTLRETGKAMIITTLVLFFAFGSLMFSPFPPTFMIGFLLSLTLGIALVADLYLNPLLMRALKI